MRSKHITELFLKYTEVPFTSTLLRKKVRRIPYNSTYAGIQEILLDYSIKSVGITLSIDDLEKIKDPFITLLKKSYIVVTSCSHGRVRYLTEYNKEETIETNAFSEQWCGSILFPEITSASGEKHHFRNRTFAWLSMSRLPLSAVSILLIVFYYSSLHDRSVRTLVILLLLLLLSGLILSVLLTMQSTEGRFPFISKLCEWHERTSCNQVLESKGAKLFGLIGWGEIGIVYFFGCFLFLLYGMSGALSLLFLINIASLPYTFWSIFYQKMIVKKWCVLCLIVQLLFYLIFIAFLIGRIPLFTFDLTLQAILGLFLSFSISAILLWWIHPLISMSQRAHLSEYTLARLKSQPVILRTLLETQPVLRIDQSARSLIVGNPDGNTTITIVSNPYCHHCADLYKRLVVFLEKYREKIRCELIFTGEDPMENIIKYLISIYFEYGSESAEKIYSKWYEQGEKTLLLYPVSTANGRVAKVYETQNKWRKVSGNKGTPIIYVDNRKLPEEYALEDIRWLF